MLEQGQEVSRTRCSSLNEVIFEWNNLRIKDKNIVLYMSKNTFSYSKCVKCIYLTTLSVDTEPYYSTQDYEFPKVEPRHLLGIVSKISTTLFGLCLKCVFKGENY